MMLALSTSGRNIMNLLPNKNLFIVTSALKPNMGVISEEDRFQQTIETLKNLRERVPDAIIFFADGSPNPIDDKIVNEISKYVNVNAYFGMNPQIVQFATSGGKSQSEILLLLMALVELKRNPQLAKMMSEVKRVFKYSARSKLHEEFDIKEYDNHFGKYIFKKKIPTWLTDGRRHMFDHLYITRMYSMCTSLIDDYIVVLQKVLSDVQMYGVDTEHGHFHSIDKKYVIEFDNLHCEGIMAGTGAIERY